MPAAPPAPAPHAYADPAAVASVMHSARSARANRGPRERRAEAMVVVRRRRPRVSMVGEEEPMSEGKKQTKPVCAVVGVGPGNGAALARRFAAEGFAVALLARRTEL